MVPLATALAVLYVVAFVITGVLSIIAALRLRKEIQGEWLLVFSGVLAVIVGVVLVAWPMLGLVMLVRRLIGAYAIAIFSSTATHCALIGSSFRSFRHGQASSSWNSRLRARKVTRPRCRRSATTRSSGIEPHRVTSSPGHAFSDGVCSVVHRQTPFVTLGSVLGVMAATSDPGGETDQLTAAGSRALSFDRSGWSA